MVFGRVSGFLVQVGDHFPNGQATISASQTKRGGFKWRFPRAVFLWQWLGQRGGCCAGGEAASWAVKKAVGQP
jgi:hypothetical protein